MIIFRIFCNFPHFRIVLKRLGGSVYRVERPIRPGLVSKRPQVANSGARDVKNSIAISIWIRFRLKSQISTVSVRTIAPAPPTRLSGMAKNGRYTQKLPGVFYKLIAYGVGNSGGRCVKNTNPDSYIPRLLRPVGGISPAFVKIIAILSVISTACVEIITLLLSGAAYNYR